MCGRATNEDELQDIALGTAAALEPADTALWRPSYNIAPTQALPVVGVREGARVLRVMRFGLVPRWAKDDRDARRLQGMCFNARGETVHEKPAFAESFAARRCLVVVTGFYEWSGAAPHRTPYWLHPRAGERYWTFAGVWRAWTSPETRETWRTVAVVTTTPNARMAMIHDRMPVILAGEDAAAWVAADTRAETLRALIAPCPDAWIAARPVGAMVGSPKNQGPALIEPLVPQTSSEPAGATSTRVA